jgi:septal ring factor EnvC (AmiA/AmiB activator)
MNKFAQLVTMKKETSLILLSLGSILFPSVSIKADTPEELRSTYKEFIQIKKIMGQETVEWERDKLMLEESISLVEAEIAQLKETLKELKDSSSEADGKRAKLREEVEASKNISESYLSTISDYEVRVSKLTSRFPLLLQRDAASVISALPEGGVSTRPYSERLLVLASVLNQADKFNNQVRLVTDVKTLDSGNVEVQTLYFGLGAAIFSDVTGGYAGRGVLGDNGWAWETVDPVQSAEIARAIRVYQSKEVPAFIKVGVTIN